MSLRKLSVIIAIVSAGLFSVLQLFPWFRLGDYIIYDIFLRIKPRHQEIDNVVFLNVDDPAIANIGVHPWPRSVIADGLLQLKEHGAKLVIFDIEYIDKSPTQVDEMYLRNGLARDYNRSFNEIGTTVTDIFNNVHLGRLPYDRAVSYINEIIENEKDTLYESTLRIATDDDSILANAAKLFGHTWGTLNLQEIPLSGEQAQRRAFAEEHFSYPVVNSGGIIEGKNADILPAIPVFTRAVKGAGYTNIDPDPDGTRRRIFLAQEVLGYWYLQLAFAPLMDTWGSPAITVQPGRLFIEGQNGKTVIPLDKDGAMLLDWPRGNYYQSYSHISFADFYFLENYLTNIEGYLQELAFINSSLFPVVARNSSVLLNYFSVWREKKRSALYECSQEDFDDYISIRDDVLDQTAGFMEYLSSVNYVDNEFARITELIGNDESGIAGELKKETEHCRSLLEYMDTELNAFFELNQRVHNKLNDRFCVIGRTDTGTTDIAVNPFHPKYINVGTHAVVLDTILSNSFITPLPVLYSILFTMIFIPFVLIGISGFKPSLRSVFGFSGVILAFCLPLVLFIITKIYLAPLGAVLAMTAAVIVRELIAFVSSEREKRFIRRAFSTYLSAGVVAELIADPSKLNLGGEKREMTVIFTDIRSFSTISERMDPTQLVRMLNRYLTVMSNIIMDNHGTIDKYEGDAIIAFFGAPIFMENHAALACRSALEMKKAEVELNKQLIAEGLCPSPLFTRIGINTGEMVVGNMGTENKMDYTVMGNAVNLAARLEGVNKQYQTGIIMSEFTKEQTGDLFFSRRLDRVRVVGIQTPVLLYELAGISENAGKNDVSFYQTWKEATAFYEQRQFTEALDLFSDLLKNNPDDFIASQYVQRCVSCIKKPPAPDWDDVVYLSEK